MRKRTTAKRLCLTAAPILAACLLIAAACCKNRLLFIHVTKSFWQEQLAEDTLSMHYTVASPENWGLKHYEATLPAYSAELAAQNAAQLETYRSSLARINPERLNAQEQLACRLLQRYLEQESLLDGYPYYHEPLSPGSGAQSQLPILFAEYAFYTERDVQDYLALLEALGPYLDGLGVYEQEKAAAGLFMSDSAAGRLIAQCDSVCNKQELEQGVHFLQLTFAERLNALCQQEALSADTRNAYLAENNRLLLTVVQPAYERLADTVFLLKGQGADTHGLAADPRGRDYYELLLHRETGSSKSAEQIKLLLLSRFEEDCDMLQKLMEDYTASSNMESDASLLSMTPEEMLAHLKASMAQDFPPFPSAPGTASAGESGTAGESVGAESAVTAQSGRPGAPACTVKTVSDSLAPYTAPAFYLTPPLDNVSSNVIYINRRSTQSGLSLYTTLAHEGYPGHLYQSVYYNLLRESTGAPAVRNLLYYGGYCEGWALYVENISYDYAKELMPDEAVRLSCSLTRLDRDIRLCLYSLLDISIHYDNASYEQVHSVLQRFGITQPAVTRSIYEYIAEEPANYPKYFVGYLEILELKEAAGKLWGGNYSEKAFHTFFLGAGPCDYATLHMLLEQTGGQP